MPEVQGVVSFSASTCCRAPRRPAPASSFITLKDWAERTDPKSDARKIAPAFGSLNTKFRDGVVFGFNPPPIQGISTTGGFELFLQDRRRVAGGVVGGGQQDCRRGRQASGTDRCQHAVFNVVPQYKINVDRDKAKTLGVPINTIFETMQSGFGSLYVNDFTLFGRTYRVSLSVGVEFRSSPNDLRFIYVRSESGRHDPAGRPGVCGPRSSDPTPSTASTSFRPPRFLGNPAPGYSSGQSLAVMQQIVTANLGTDYSIGWTGSAYQEISTAGTGYQGFLFGMLMVFLILAAQYERWSLPLAVLTAVPFALFGAIVAIWLRGIENDIYFQIGLVTLIGLAAKNAILIVEFAAERHRQGLSVYEAAFEAARLRFRPDHHDLAGVHSRCAAARDLHRRGLGQPALHRHRRHRRNDRGHGARDHFRSAVLPSGDTRFQDTGG